MSVIGGSVKIIRNWTYHCGSSTKFPVLNSDLQGSVNAQMFSAVDRGPKVPATSGKAVKANHSRQARSYVVFQEPELSAMIAQAGVKLD